MDAWAVTKPGPLSTHPLRRVERPEPEPGPHEVVVRVAACGVCRTDLHVVEGDLSPHKEGVIPGHEIVGIVAERGDGASRFAVGDRVGVAWLRWTCGGCRFCTTGRENLCEQPRFTGYDDDGGYAHYAVVHEEYAHPLPDGFDDVHAAPLLCAGIIGYRALRRAAVPPKGKLGIYGFGGSAHIAAQVAVHEGATVHVMTRSQAARELATRLGVASVQDTHTRPPEPLDSAILFAPTGDLVPVALESLDRGGTLAIAGIHLSEVPALDYERHLFSERNLVSVTANTRTDAREFLEVAARIPVQVSAIPFPFEKADEALKALATGRLAGAAVLEMPGLGRVV